MWNGGLVEGSQVFCPLGKGNRNPRIQTKKSSSGSSVVPQIFKCYQGACVWGMGLRNRGVGCENKDFWTIDKFLQVLERGRLWVPWTQRHRQVHFRSTICISKIRYPKVKHTFYFSKLTWQLTVE